MYYDIFLIAIFIYPFFFSCRFDYSIFFFRSSASTGLFRVNPDGRRYKLIRESPDLPYNSIVKADAMTDTTVSFLSQGNTDLSQISTMLMRLTRVTSSISAGDQLRISMGPSYWKFIAPTTEAFESSIFSRSTLTRSVYTFQAEGGGAVDPDYVPPSHSTCRYSYAPTANTPAEEWTSVNLAPISVSSSQMLMEFPQGISKEQGSVAEVICEGVRNPSVLISENKVLTAEDATFDVLDNNSMVIMSKEPMSSKVTSNIVRI